MRGDRKNYGKGEQMRRVDVWLRDDHVVFLKSVGAHGESVQDTIRRLIDIRRVEMTSFPDYSKGVPLPGVKL